MPETSSPECNSRQRSTANPSALSGRLVIPIVVLTPACARTAPSVSAEPPVAEIAITTVSLDGG